MRHQKTGRKLGRTSAQRRSLMMNLATSIILHERIRTTEAKAKEMRSIVDKLITLGKKGDVAARRQAISILRSKDTVHKLFADVAPRYAERNGGYTRIVKLGPRQGDNAEMVLIEFV